METEKKFRLQNKRFLLTYKTHLVKEEFKEHLETILKGKKIKDLLIAHETGDENMPYNHTHVVFSTAEIVQTTNARFFDFKEIHPHIKVLSSPKAFKDAQIYVCKEDPELVDKKNKIEESKTPIAEMVWEHNTIQEALTSCVKKYSDVQGVISLYKLKQKEFPLSEEDIPNKQWQLDLLEEVKNNAPKRKIVWIFDKIGNTGKTQIAKYLMVTEQNNWLCCKDMGTSRDASTIVENALEKGWKGHGFILDLPRQAENHKRMYSYIEEIKDGFMTSQKYSGNTIIFSSPHLIVFSNWKPIVNSLSLDRWDIRELVKNDDDSIIMKKYEITKDDLENDVKGETFNI